MVIATAALIVASLSAGADVVTATREPTIHISIPAATDGPQREPTQTGCWSSSEQGGAGWGPDRPLFSGNHSPSYPSLNATPDNPNYGDERNFLLVKDAAALDPRAWSDRIEVQPGHEYMVRLYIHNAAEADDLVAKDTKTSVALPTCAGHAIAIYGFVKSSNSFPDSQWDGVVVWSRETFNLAFVPDSAVLLNNANPSPGIALRGESGVLTGEGVLVGSTGMDGELLPGYSGSVIITFKFRSQFAPR